MPRLLEILQLRATRFVQENRWRGRALFVGDHASPV